MPPSMKTTEVIGSSVSGRVMISGSQSEKQAGLTLVEYLGSRLMWKARLVTKESELQ